MHKLYSSGKIAEFTNRILALAARFDDDGELDVFLFGEHAHQPAPMQLANSRGYIERITKEYPLEGGTDYGKAIAMIRRHYFPKSTAAQRQPQKDRLHVYVMFLTDGQTSNESFTERQIAEASYEPIFWQFMGMDEGGWQRVLRAALLAAFAAATLLYYFHLRAKAFSPACPPPSRPRAITA